MKKWRPVLPQQRAYKKEVFRKAGIVSKLIYQIGETEMLRRPSEEVPIKKITSSEMQQKFAYIKKCLLDYRKLTGLGRGIAAVQIGLPEKFAVVYTSKRLLIIVNPKITEKSDKIFKYSEMCMSANPIIAPVVRPAWIEFSYFNEDGKKQYWDTKDDTDRGKIMNRVFEHEIDHMYGWIY